MRRLHRLQLKTNSLKHYKEAIADGTEALKGLDFPDCTPHYIRAISFEASGETKKAIFEWKTKAHRQLARFA